MSGSGGGDMAGFLKGAGGEGGGGMMEMLGKLGGDTGMAKQAASMQGVGSREAEALERDYGAKNQLAALSSQPGFMDQFMAGLGEGPGAAAPEDPDQRRKDMAMALLEQSQKYMNG